MHCLQVPNAMCDARDIGFAEMQSPIFPAVQLLLSPHTAAAHGIWHGTQQNMCSSLELWALGLDEVHMDCRQGFGTFRAGRVWSKVVFSLWLRSQTSMLICNDIRPDDRLLISSSRQFHVLTS